MTNLVLTGFVNRKLIRYVALERNLSFCFSIKTLFGPMRNSIVCFLNIESVKLDFLFKSIIFTVVFVRCQHDDVVNIVG